MRSPSSRLLRYGITTFLCVYVGAAVSSVYSYPRTMILTTDGKPLASLFDGIEAVASPQISTRLRQPATAQVCGATCYSERTTSVTRSCPYCALAPQFYECYEPPCGQPRLRMGTGNPSDGCIAQYGCGECAQDSYCFQCAP
jgi:hypothetical protein